MKNLWITTKIIAGLMMLSTTTFANETNATLDAYAAGYKAAFTCSSTFNAGKLTTEIAKHELTGIYPLVQDRINTLPAAEIDITAKQVLVHYSDTMPARIAQWRPHLGCVSLPVGANKEAIQYLPVITDSMPSHDSKTDEGQPWIIRAEVNQPTGNTKLDTIVRKAFTKNEYGSHARTSAILIATPEQIIVEHYKEGFTPTTSQRTWSVAKSIAATVIGAAVQRNIVDINATAIIPEWSNLADPRRKITLKNLLHMASGLDSNKSGSRTDRVYMGGGLITDTATEAALEAIPGRRWKYANNDTLLAIRHLRAAIDNDASYHAFPFKALLYKIGMNHTFLETDWEGNFILSSQVWTTSRDLARLGLLYLNDGKWKNDQILPPEWARYVATPAPAQPQEPKDGTPSQRYGAQWWLYDNYPDLPNDTYAALGNRGQILMIIPSKNLILVRRGYDLADGEGFQMHTFAADILKALE